MTPELEKQLRDYLANTPTTAFNHGDKQIIEILLDEIIRLRKELKLQLDMLAAMKYAVVDTVGGTDYEGNPTSEINYLQRLRILVEREKTLLEIIHASPDSLPISLKILREQQIWKK